MLLAATILPGCGGTETASKSKEAAPIKPLSVVYGLYVGRHRGQAPPNEAELKAFAASPDAKPILDTFKVASFESLLTSPRDNKPYVIVYGAPKGPPGPGMAPVVIYEQQGSGGMRYVASSLGAIEEVDEATFKKYVP